MFWIFVRIASVPRFYEEIRTKQDLSYLSWNILYNSKFILIATSLGTNAVLVTRLHYTVHVFWYVCLSSSFIDSGLLFHFYRLRLAFPLQSTLAGFSIFINSGWLFHFYWPKLAFSLLLIQACFSTFIDIGWLFHFYRLRLVFLLWLSTFIDSGWLFHFYRLRLAFPLLSTQAGYSKAVPLLQFFCFRDSVDSSVAFGLSLYVPQLFFFRYLGKHYENTPIKIYWKFHHQKRTFSDKKKIWYFSYFCSKHRLWVLVRTASARRF